MKKCSKRLKRESSSRIERMTSYRRPSGIRNMAAGHEAKVDFRGAMGLRRKIVYIHIEADRIGRASCRERVLRLV